MPAPSPFPTIMSESTQYVYSQITSAVPGISNLANPTQFPVAVAIVPPGVAPSAYTAAAWVAGAPIPTVQFLVGPQNGGILLPPGDFRVFVQITATPEVPVIYAGILRVVSSET